MTRRRVYEGEVNAANEILRSLHRLELQAEMILALLAKQGIEVDEPDADHEALEAARRKLDWEHGVV